MLPVFVINLDRSPERLARFSRQCTDAGVSFERFHAVDGVNLPDRLKPYFCDASGEIVSPLRHAEIGCYASHLGVWQRIASDNIPAAIICEDDAVLPRGFDAIIRDIVAELPTEWDLVLLANPTQTAVKSIGRTLIRYSRVPGGTGCYLISRAGAAKMLLPVAPRIWALDHDTRWPWKFGMNTYGVRPAPVTRYLATSTINPAGGGRSRLRAGLARSPQRTLQSFLFNLRQLGPWSWAQCAVVNSGVKVRKLLAPLSRRVQARKPATS